MSPSSSPPPLCLCVYVCLDRYKSGWNILGNQAVGILKMDSIDSEFDYPIFIQSSCGLFLPEYKPMKKLQKLSFYYMDMERWKYPLKFDSLDKQMLHRQKVIMDGWVKNVSYKIRETCIFIKTKAKTSSYNFHLVNIAVVRQGMW